MTLVVREFESHQSPMSFRNPDEQRQYQAIWMWRRRLRWILDNGPCRCGSTKDLQVVYKDPAEKTVRVTSIWSLREERRAELLLKCIVLCATCAKEKRKEERRVNEDQGDGNLKATAGS